MPYQEREIRFSGEGGFELSGTFCAPQGQAKGVALIIAGSGPTDRNCNSSLGIIPGKGYLKEVNLYRDLAHNLAEQGIATLRYDKRACWSYRKQWKQFLGDVKGKERLHAMGELFSFDHVSSDAEMARQTLLSQPESQHLPLSLIGHSEGGLIAMRMAQHEKVDNLVLLAAAGRPFGDILKEQLYNITLKKSHDKKQADEVVAQIDQALQIIEQKQPLPEHMSGVMRSLFNESTRQHMEQTLRRDPAKMAKDIQANVLIVNGTNDVQISAEKDAEALYRAFSGRDGGHRQDLVKIKGASHCFKYPVTPDDIKTSFTGPMAPELSAAVGSFLNPLGKYMKRDAAATMQR